MTAQVKIIPETTNDFGDFLYLGCRSAYSRATFSMQGQAFCGLRS